MTQCVSVCHAAVFYLSNKKKKKKKRRYKSLEDTGGVSYKRLTDVGLEAEAYSFLVTFVVHFI